MRVIIAGIIGGLVIFLWSAFAHRARLHAPINEQRLTH